MFEIFSRYMRLAKTVAKTDDLETLLATAKNIERDLALGTFRLSSIEENGFAAFLERTTINHYEHGTIPLVLYDFQRELADTIQNNRVVLVEHARQMGITFIITRYAAHTGLSLPGQNIAVVGHSFNWSREMAHNLCEAISHMDVIEKTTRDSIHLRNGTVIHVVSASQLTQTIRRDDNLLTGMKFGFDTVIFDNANYISFSIVDDITRLLLRSNVSKIIAASTSTHKDGAMMQSLCNGFPEATIVNLPWFLHPHRDEQWMEKTKNILGEDAFTLEYECRLKR